MRICVGQVAVGRARRGMRGVIASPQITRRRRGVTRRGGGRPLRVGSRATLGGVGAGARIDLAAKPNLLSKEIPVIRSLVLAVVLFGVWLVWSGHFTPLLVGFGAGSCVGVLLLCRRMRIVDEEGVPVQLGLRPLFPYLPWLVKEIARANLDVARRIVDPRLPIRPSVLRVKASQKGELGRVVYANSITLTPGTVSMGVEHDEIVVHALSAQSAQSAASGEMDRRVSRMEGAR